MEENISRSEKKRRAKGVEKLVLELFELSAKDLAALPAGPGKDKQNIWPRSCGRKRNWHKNC
jgi:ribosomal 50S subunit-associated protein YjgA (DUF615 family)